MRAVICTALASLALRTAHAQPAPTAQTVPPAPAQTAPTALPEPSRNQDVAWLLVGGALTFATAGAVLAYSTSSSEQDIKDLYATTSGNPPAFDAATRRRYNDLVDEGERYQTLAWVAFGVAAASAIGATVFFVRARGDVEVAPVVSPAGGGVSATLRF